MLAAVCVAAVFADTVAKWAAAQDNSAPKSAEIRVVGVDPLARIREEKDLPEPLAVEAVDHFLINSRAAYTLEWNKDPNNRYAIPRPANTNGLESLAIARFSNGWILICLYPAPNLQPECVSRWQVGQ